MAKTAKKVSLILGLTPVTAESVEFHRKVVGDLKSARKLAVEEYLTYYLNFGQEEVN